ncbi:hemin receptor [Mesobaculum littorinae]|uniref:Hemin receptor n=1 Tax=Mesobaculum littorinae TaxID=2486419 RepID=A0A438AEG7_9RHOB|nr:globin domain-containing protein [Mesobaculum littorinae]RVV97015.1 hemin receptor [Mesobaculum littorinae]
MTPEQMQLVKASFSTIYRRKRQAGTLLYSRLFAMAPQVRPMFGEDIAPQVEMLVTMVTAILRAADDEEKLRGLLRPLALRHAAYGAVPAHYNAVGIAFLGTLDDILGDRLTPEMRAAWGAAYAEVAQRMIALSSEAAPANL